jgi:hypothetical protein
MTTNQFREAMGACPFRPFAIRAADGREYRVDHPEMARATPDGRVLFVATSDDSAAAPDLLLVTALEPVEMGRAGPGPHSGSGPTEAPA